MTHLTDYASIACRQSCTETPNICLTFSPLPSLIQPSPHTSAHVVKQQASGAPLTCNSSESAEKRAAAWPLGLINARVTHQRSDVANKTISLPGGVSWSRWTRPSHHGNCTRWRINKVRYTLMSLKEEEESPADMRVPQFLLNQTEMSIPVSWYSMTTMRSKVKIYCSFKLKGLAVWFLKIQELKKPSGCCKSLM